MEGVVSGFREFMLAEGFTEIHSPKIVSAGAEGGANIFKLKYFDKDAFLTQSPQFYKQTCVAFFDRVFEIAPVYRAERHNTSRHLNEYIGLDFEMGFIDSMYDVMQMEVAMLRYTVEYIASHYQNELKILGASLPEVGEIPCVTFEEAMEILRGPGKKIKTDLDPEDEVKLCEYAEKEYGSELIFVTHFPSAKRPFYAMDDPENPRLALSFDLLLRGLEITTGGQRIHDYGEQVAKMERMGLNPSDFADYLNIHRYGMPPHGGLGIGLERLVMKLLSLQNIRQSSLFPRDLNHINP
jgi:aspartyl/asparaginyl-tRNA synthetase